jgi:predicted GIY-YIG superfamily endonuclease
MSEQAILYVIELEPGEDPNAQWYVGITDDIERRISQHRGGPGAIWTERNTIVEEYPLGQAERREAKQMENHLTKFLMQEFGVDSTRGGDYTYPSLENRPTLGDILLPPTMGRLLLDSGKPPPRPGRAREYRNPAVNSGFTPVSFW